MKYYIIAGEASGDLHGSNLIRSIKREDSDASVRCWGGDLMEAAGAEVVKHYRELAFMGFWEVFKNLPEILGNLRRARRDIKAWKPDAVILIDFPGFNLRIAKWATKQGLRVFYYISPQIWAWHTSRVHRMKKYIERLYVILPFESQFFQRFDYEVDYVGHPLLDVTEQVDVPDDWRVSQGLDNRPIVALLPGSRKQEIEAMLPLMASVSSEFPGFQFVIAGAPSIDEDLYERILSSTSSTGQDISVVSGVTYELIKASVAALVTSGTATLETALLGTPQVVCYKSSTLSYWLAKRLVRVDYISLVNLIVEEPVVKELIQGELSRESLTDALGEIISEEGRKRMLKGYALMRQKIGQPGASARAGRLMVRRLIG